MPRPRGSEMPQRVSPRGPPPLRTSSSDSDPLHHRPITDRSPRLGERRSPRGVQSEPMNQKKLGTRIAGLETQLEQAQEELKILKGQLASAEAAKKEAQTELEKKTAKPVIPELVLVEDKHSSPNETQESNINEIIAAEQENLDDNQKETDVFEVPVEKSIPKPEIDDLCQGSDQDVLKTKPVSIPTELQGITEPEKPTFEELAQKNEEINLLKSKIEEKAKELELFGQGNESLKGQLKEATSERFSAEAKEEEMGLKLNHLEEELETSKNNVVELSEKLKEVEAAKETLETEMKKLRVQTEQWRKAADAAAAVLAGGAEMMNNGRRISERCGSMDKQHYGSVFEPQAGGYAGFVGSPGLGEDSDDGFGNGKRKGSGIRMFGDLWKKKGQK